MSYYNRRAGGFSPANIMNYLIVLYIIGAIIIYTNPDFYVQYLALDPAQVLRGQVWRLVTFLIYPPSTNILWLILETWIFYTLAMALERAWGLKRFNIYVVCGIIFCIIGAFVVYFVWGDIAVYMTFGTAGNMYMSMLLALAATFPNVEFLLYFIIPIKAKWLGLFYLALLVYEFIAGTGPTRVMLAFSLLNFVIFFLLIANPFKKAKKYKRRTDFNKKAAGGSGYGFFRDPGAAKGAGSANSGGYSGTPEKRVIINPSGTMHRCAVCGRTEKDSPQLDFRFCSKCAGLFEYCSEHLYTHKHVLAEGQKDAGSNDGRSE